MTRSPFARGFAAAVVVALARPSPAVALRTQAGLESPETRRTLTASLTGLEESRRAYDNGVSLDRATFRVLLPKEVIGLQVREGQAIEYYEALRHIPTNLAIVVFIRVAVNGRRIEPVQTSTWSFDDLVGRFPRLVTLATGLEEPPSGPGVSWSDALGSVAMSDRTAVPQGQSPLSPRFHLKRDATEQVTAVYAYDEGDDVLTLAWTVPLTPPQAEAYLAAAQALADMTHKILSHQIPTPAAPSGATIRYVLQGEGLSVAPAFAAAGIRDFVAIVKTVEARTALRALGVDPRNILMMAALDTARIPNLAEGYWLINTAQEAEWLAVSLQEAQRIPPALADPLTGTIRASRKFLAAIGV